MNVSWGSTIYSMCVVLIPLQQTVCALGPVLMDWIKRQYGNMLAYRVMKIDQFCTLPLLRLFCDVLLDDFLQCTDYYRISQYCDLICDYLILTCPQLSAKAKLGRNT